MDKELKISAATLKEEIEPEHSEAIKKQEHLQNIQKQVSPYAVQYATIMSDIPIPNFFEFSSSFMSSKIQYHPESFYSSLVSQVTGFGIEDHMFVIQVHISHFTLFLSIYFRNEDFSEQNDLKLINQGSFGFIYGLDECLVMKSINFEGKPENKKNGLKIALQEYCLYYIASALRVGPSIVNDLGFDLLIYNDCVQFAVEKCKPIQHRQKQQLREALKLLHSLHIIHGDIKPDNIMYSERYKKNVFIDFNCSSIVPQKVGQSSFTTFKGTLQYASPEMIKIWTDRKGPGFVDLYYNDVFALQKVKLNAEYTYLEEKDVKKWLTEVSTSFYTHTLLRYKIFCMDYNNIFPFLQANIHRLTPSKQFQRLRIAKKKSESYEKYELSIKNLQYTEIMKQIQQTMSLKVLQSNLRKYKQIKRILEKYFSFFILRNFTSQQHLKDLVDLIRFTSQDCVIQENIANPISVFLRQGKNLAKGRNLLNKIQHLDDKLTLRKMYYEFLSCNPSDQQIDEVLKTIKVKMKIEGPLLYSIKMMQHIDKVFGKKRKFFIWKINKFRSLRRQNWIMNLCLTLCLIRSVSKSQELIKHSNISTNLQGVFANVEQMKRWKYPHKSIKFTESLMYRFCRILEATTHLKFKQISKLEKIFETKIKLFEISQIQWKNYLCLFNRVKNALFHQRGKKRSFQLFQEKQNELKNEKVYATKDQIMFQYNKMRQFAQSPLQQLILNCSGTKQLIQAFQRLEETFLYQQNYFCYLTKIMYELIENSFKGNFTDFFQCFFENSVKYFCTLSCSDITSEDIRQIIVHFNLAFITLRFQFSSEQKLKDFQRLIEWVSSEDLSKSNQLHYRSLIFSLISSCDPKIRSHLLMKNSKLLNFCLFQILDSPQLVGIYGKQINEQLAKIKIIDYKNICQVECEAQVIIERLTLKKQQALYSQNLLYSLLIHQNYSSFVDYLKMLSELFEGDKFQAIKQLEFFGVMIKQRYFLLRQLSSSGKKQFLEYYYSKVLNNSGNFPANFILWHMSLMGEIFLTWKEQQKESITPLLKLNYEKCFLMILKSQHRCSFIIRKRIRQNTSAILEKLLEIHKSTSFQSIINPKLISQLRKTKLRLYLLRSSLFPTSKSFKHNAIRVSSQVKKAKIKETLLGKFEKLIKNKKSTFFSKFTALQTSQQSMVLSIYINQPILQIQKFY